MSTNVETFPKVAYVDAAVAAEAAARAAAIAAQHAADSTSYVAPLLALDTDGVYFPAQPAGVFEDTDGTYYFSPGYVGAAKAILDTDSVPYPVAIGA